jgi:uncharacterized protein (DUF362 family)/Pyruvate/2-oxoacid:ferredoxin oxidoreductase delta subunit
MASVEVRRAAYDDALEPTIYDMLAGAGGARFARGRVLIKPNLLLAARPERAITTHPKVVRAVVKFVLDHGGRPVVADSPAVGSLSRIFRAGAYREALTDLGVSFQAFKEEAEVDIGPPFGRVPLAREALEADAVINLAKLKTHSQMTLTLGVKNTFGCVVGLKKSEWHLRAGIDKSMFARLIVQIHQTVRPAFTLIDGILGLEGHGPGLAGRPVSLGILVGSRSAFAADHAVCNLIGHPPDWLPTLKAADSLSIPHRPVQMSGDGPERLQLQLPKAGRTQFGPAFLQPLLRRHLFRRPVADVQSCRLCGECWKYCPAQAIQYRKDQLRFDYNRCIRCYCCIEVCPHGAMTSAETVPGRWLRYVRSRVRGTDAGGDF